MEMIEVDAERRVFLLTGAGFGYAIWCAPHVVVHDQEVPDPLVHLYWGPPISLADAVGLVPGAVPARRPFESVLDGIEEYPPAGGLRFELTALDIDATWRYAGHHVAGDELTIEFVGGRVRQSLHYRVVGGALERWVVLANEGVEPARHQQSPRQSVVRHR
jgi:alpha-galactosidase